MLLLLTVDCRVGGNQSIKCHVKEVKTYKQGPSCRVGFQFIEALTTNGRVGRFPLAYFTFII